MALNIHVPETEIKDGNIDCVRQNMEPVVEDSEMIKRFENAVALNFDVDSLFDLVSKLNTEPYKKWFSELDREIPVLPYFLSNSQSNSLLVFLMGVLDFKERDNKIFFDPMKANRFFREKVVEIKNLCHSNNVNPQQSISRLSLLLADEELSTGSSRPDAELRKGKISCTDKKEPNNKKLTDTQHESKVETEQKPKEKTDAVEKKPNKETEALKKLLDQYGSVAVFTGERITKIFLVLDQIHGQFKLKKNELVINKNINANFFRTTIDCGDQFVEIRSILLYRLEEVVTSIKENNGVKLQGIIKVEDGTYQQVFELDEPIRTTIVEESIERKVETEPAKQPSQSLKETPQEQSANIASLQKEIEALKEELQQKNRLLEVYEEELQRRGTLKGFVKKFFK